MDVVLAFDSDRAVGVLAGIPSEHGLVIDFQTSAEGSATLNRATAAHEGRWTVKHVSSVFAAAQERARSDYLAQHASWPQVPSSEGRSFVDITQWDVYLSLWWASSASMKDNEVDPLFTHLTWIGCFEELCAGHSVMSCNYAGKDRVFARLLQRYCRERGLRMTSSVLPAGVGRRGMVTLAVAMAYVMVVGVALATVARLWWRGRARSASRGRIALFSIIPETLILVPDGAVRDRNYARLASALGEAGAPSVYLLWQRVSFAGVWCLLRMLRQRPSDDVVPLAAYLRLRDVLSLIGYAASGQRVRRAIVDPALRVAQPRCLVPLDEEIQSRVRHSFFGPDVLRNLLAYHATVRWAKEAECPVLVQFLGTYPLGLATYAGLRRAGTRTRTVAYQHATYTRWKLWVCHLPSELSSMPQPDLFVCQGPSYADVLAVAGVPRNRVALTGSPRYDRLAEHARSRPVPGGPAGEAQRLRAGGHVPVLVATSLSLEDATALVEASVRVATAHPDLWLVFRGHPDLKIEELVQSCTRRQGLTRFSFGGGDLYEWLDAVDGVVVSYSTVGDEAAALGAPVVCFAGIIPSMSGLADTEEAVLARTEEALGAHLEALIQHRNGGSGFSDQAREAIVRRLFHRLDGGAAGRVTQVILKLATEAGSMGDGCA